MSRYEERVGWVLGGQPPNIGQACTIAAEADAEIERLRETLEDIAAYCDAYYEMSLTQLEHVIEMARQALKGEDHEQPTGR